MCFPSDPILRERRECVRCGGPILRCKPSNARWPAERLPRSARTLQLLGGLLSGIPVLGAVAAGGLVETFDDVQERLDLAPVLETRGLFALTVNGDSMVDAYIADGDVVLMEPVPEPSRLRDGTVVSALVPGSGTTLKHFHRKGATVLLEAANPAYEPIELPADQVQVQGKLVAVWRQV